MTKKVFMKLNRPGKSDDDSPLVKLLREQVLEEAKANGESGDDVYFAIASTPALDRDDEVLIPRGVQITDFMKNPVMLHIHNYRQVSVGKTIKLGVSDEEIGFAFKFAETPAGEELRYLYDEEFMSAFSVGFIPRAFVRVSDETPDKIDIDVNDNEKMTNGDNEKAHVLSIDQHRTMELGCIEVDKDERGEYKQVDAPVPKYRLDLSRYERRPRAIVARWELLEVSPVPVPSNPEALLVRAVRKAHDAYKDDPQRQRMAEDMVRQEMAPLVEKLSAFLNKDAPAFEDKTVVRAHTTPIDNDAAWSGDAARASLARWASTDGSGSKETMNWGKFANGYGWFDGNSVENFMSYKLPHHVARDGELVAIWNGITSAMGALMGARGGVDVQGQDLGVYNHLARHYRDNDREPPPFEREYDEMEIKAIAEDTWKWSTEEEAFVDTDGKVIRRTGAAENHDHTYDDTRAGRTSTANDHWHATTAGSNRTGPPNTDPEGHTHTLPVTIRAQDEPKDGEGDLKEVVDGLQSRFDELEASIGVRLGVVTDIIEEMVANVVQAVGTAEGSAGDKGAGKGEGDDNAGGSGQGQNPEDKALDDEGATRLVGILGGRFDS